MTELKIYLPYSSKGMFFLHKIEKLYNAKWSVGENEIVTIKSTAKRIEKIKILFKKMLDK